MAGRWLLGTALIGMAILVFETILTRIFAVTLWYYFGFLAISIALLGISAGGMVVYLRPNLGKQRPGAVMAVCAALFAVTACLAVLFHLNVTFIGTKIGEIGFYTRMLGQVFVLTVPFFFGGLCLALMFSRFHEHIARIYFFDLAGSGIGCVLVIIALHAYSGPAIVFLVSSLAALAAVAFAPAKHQKIYAVLMVAFGAAFVLNDGVGLLDIQTTKSYARGKLQASQRRTLVAEDWSPISRTTAYGPYKGRKFEYLRVFNNAGAPTNIHKFRGSVDAMRYTTKMPRKVIHHFVDGHQLLIGAGGGYEIWAALATGHTIVAVELNPITVGWVRHEFAEFSGDPYGQPGVTAVIDEGRNFVAHTDDAFDIIELTMVDSWIGNAAGAFMFIENNLYTVEAVHDYRSKLTDGGVLSISRYYPYNEALRVASVMSQALIEEGVEDPGQYMIVNRDRRGKVATVMSFMRPVSEELARAVEAKTRELGGKLLYAPHLGEDYFASDKPDDENFRRLLAPARYETTREEFIDQFPRDISPTTDDRPFFFYMVKGAVFETNPDEHAARRLALPIIYGLFASLLLLSLLFLVVPAVWLWRSRGAATMPPLPLLLYFSCLGVAFMLVEIPLIQKFVLFLGHPTYAFTVILSSILVFSGIGSYLSGRIRLEERPRRVIPFLAALVAVLVATLFAVDPVLHALLGIPFGLRLLFTVLFLAPAAMAMGVPFPSGIRILSRHAADAVPWAWAINGAFSVLATVFATVIALNFGLRMALAIGCITYVAALGLAALQLRREA